MLETSYANDENVLAAGFIPTEVPTVQVVPGVTDAAMGRVAWAPAKSLWVTGMGLVALVGGALTVSVAHVAVFLVTTAVTLCLGHSLGMHRRLIHQSYQCPRWLEYALVHLGVLVGLAGPFGMTRAHDTRDWAQRQARCHPYFSHGSAFWKDGFWRIHCEVALAHPPRFVPGAVLTEGRVYRLMERTWMLQQVPWALLLWALGGVGWVVWGIAVRVAVSVTGHWLIGYFAHHADAARPAHGAPSPASSASPSRPRWHVAGAGVQGLNVRFCGLLTMGECWHNNHHAFPGSARLGFGWAQADPGWWVLRGLRRLGLVWGLRLPADLPPRAGLVVMGATHGRPLPGSMQAVGVGVESGRL